MEKFDGALRGMASSRWGVASFTLATALLPWIIAFAPPLLKSLQVGFATDAWRLLLGWLTTPVLFLLLNFVIISIWATSASNSSPLKESPVEATTAVLGSVDISKRKETLIVLPPVSPKKSYSLQASVFTRSPPPQISVVEEPEAEEQGILTARESLALSDDSSEEMKMIPPPPPPSFLVEQQQQHLKKQKQFVKRNSDSKASSNNSNNKVRARRSLSERARGSSISFGGVAEHPGDMNNVVAESTDELRMRFESVIANFHAQLRLQTRSE